MSGASRRASVGARLQHHRRYFFRWAGGKRKRSDVPRAKGGELSLLDSPPFHLRLIGMMAQTCAAKRRRRREKRCKSSTSLLYVQFLSLHGDQQGSQLGFNFFLPFVVGAHQAARMVFGWTLDWSPLVGRWTHAGHCLLLSSPKTPSISPLPPEKKKPHLCCTGDPSLMFGPGVAAPGCLWKDEGVEGKDDLTPKADGCVNS